MLIIKDKDLNEIGILDNAYNKKVKRRVNELWIGSFSMPIDDPKNNLCSHFNYIDIYGASGRYYGLYRIMPTETKKSENKITYKCEHVLATLLDDLIDGYMPALINQTTTVNIQRILNLQTKQNWVLGNVDFIRYFQYAFENENGLLAPLLSISKPLNEPYEWTFDTAVYPWKLNLVKSSVDVKAEIRWGKDMKSFDEVSDPTNIVNYVIPKGSGEGKNQTRIDDVNGGLSYLKDDESIVKWGKHSFIWIDKRFTDADPLKANGQSLLDQWKDPSIAFKSDSVDLSILPEYQHERKVLNGVTRIIVEDKEYFGRILQEDIPDLSKEYDVTYEINNKLDDIATIQADVERRIQVNQAYSQGATNILTANETENADTNYPVKFRLKIPPDVEHVNYMELTWETDYFRGYERSIKGGGGTTKSTTNGGSSTQTSSSGGGVSKSTASGGSSTQTSAAGGDHYHLLFAGTGATATTMVKRQYYAYLKDDSVTAAINLEMATGGSPVYTYDSSGDHVHSVSIPTHSHSFSTPDHSHTVSIPAHNHSVTIDPHTHGIDFGIYEHNAMPSALEITVDGTIISQTGLQGNNIDISSYLLKDSSGKIQRDRFAEIEIRPIGEIARINATVVWGVFVQSHKGKQL